MMKNGIKVQGARSKAQGARCKIKGSRVFPCALHLVPCHSCLAFPAVQRGFSLVSAIFLLVVIAALGAFAVTLSASQQQSAALDMLGSRAYQAARAGIEWGAYQVLQNGNCASQTLPVLPNTLAGFSVQVSCAGTSATEAGVTVTMYQLTSVATQGAAGTPAYVERQMSATLAK